MMEEKLYFAYGSNINLEQMAVRCPNARPVRPVILDNYRLAFRGNAGYCGVATVIPARGEKVYGLLWKITPDCERALDRYEGYPHLYGKEQITVRDKDGGSHKVMAYIMTHEYSRDPAEPSESYFRGIVRGYQANGLPVRALFEAVQRIRIEMDEHDTKPLYQLNFDNMRKPKPYRKNTPER